MENKKKKKKKVRVFQQLRRALQDVLSYEKGEHVEGLRVTTRFAAHSGCVNLPR
ncbi:MAG TPA: hypothetical protein VGA40_01040 [Candidatus Acidoferrales bacterium]